jgi:class 3 adenylate cyclase/tetratricopeptide (TPR) repeat protein
VQRKTVTVLFCDITGSTALGESVDPEALRALLARYFQRMKAIIERHGGTVEKFIGDAVMAVFGVPAAHEDDALRAVRAAAEMRDALPELGVRARIGVNTGEVVTGTEERLATGDAVNVAARLEQAAAPDEVLIGASTLALVRDSAEVEQVEPLKLKGKTAPVAAFRLLRVGEAPERRHEMLFVGRQSELAVVGRAWQRAQAEPRCELVTVLGDAGVGKSRLVAEFLRSVEGTVVRGRCLHYGDGITYWPVVEVLRQLRALPTDAAAAAAIRSLLGEGDAVASADEIAWAVRKVLEQAAAERPLVVVLDDIQWGEETFLDLIEHVALLSRGAPILLLCMARPEIVERRPTWPVTVRIEPLGADEVDNLIPGRVAGKLRARITRAAGGNPLFIGEMVAMADESTGEVVVPPTLQALLAARLDQLDPPERSVLERGAVEGEIFHRGAVEALTPEEEHVTRRLAALVRKALIRPDTPQLPNEDGFRFRHLLIRDAAYDALSKAARADLHERFAGWLEERGAALVELDEIAGYHLEQACRYRVELGSPADDRLRSAARRHLAAAGRRAFARTDNRAAVNLLERAAALMAPNEIDLALETTLADALFEMGTGADALARMSSLADRARAVGDTVGELCGRIQQGRFRTFLEPEGATQKLERLLEEALPVLEAARDDTALYAAYYARADVAGMRAHMDTMVEALDRAVPHARKVGAPPILLGWRSTGRLYGTTPVSQFLRWLDEEEGRELPNVFLRRDRAPALAMLGRFDEARAILAEVRADLADRGASVQAGATAGIMCVEVELLAGDPAAGALFGEEGCRLLGELNERSFRSTAAGLLARAYFELGRLDDADVWARRASELGASDDALTQMLWRQVRARVLALRGEYSEAERLAREAVAIGERIQALSWQADSYANLGEVLGSASRTDEAAAALEDALARYERKGNLVMAQRTRVRLSQFRAAAPLRSFRSSV